jgi:DNA mismatch repair protein MutS2
VEPTPDELRSQTDLEWPELLRRIAALSLSVGGQERVLALKAAPDPSVALERQTTLGEVVALLSMGSPLPVRRVEALGDAASRAEKGGILSGEELYALGRMLDAGLELARFGKTHAELAPRLARALDLDAALAEISRDVSSKIEEGGRVHDRASPGVRESRREVQELSRRIKRELDELIGRHREALQDSYFAEREGRFVLPVRSDAPYRVEGAVLGTSASGATLYVEPRELSPLLNRLRLAEERLRREEELVRKELSELVAAHVEEVRLAADVCEFADFLAACGRFSHKIGARVTPLSDGGEMRLVGARHPLLADQGFVVPFEGKLDPGSGLIVSGPNAGGKTVTLKTLGLLALMQASGLPLPLDAGSSVPFFSKVMSDIGDDQSLLQSLSTFSGHVERVARMLNLAEPGVLILFDELMAGTDPIEGSALAVALAGEFVTRGAMLVVTTHYEALKSLAEADSRFQNAAVGFDFQNMRPTFEVHFGRAAGSSALIVAERHGLERTLVERARGLLPEILVRTEEDRKAAEAMLVTVSEQKKAIQNELERQRQKTDSLEREHERLKEARRRALVDESDTLRQGLRDARRELERRRDELKAATPESLAQIERGLSDVAKTISIGSDVDKSLRGNGAPAAPKDLALGSRVRILSLGLEGEIIEGPSKGSVRVLAGGLKLSVQLGDLGRPGAKADKTKPEKTAKNAGFSPRRSEPALRSLSVPLRTDDVTLDLRGQRVEAGLLELDTFIDNLLLRRELGGYVLHGHGTGAMKDAVRSHLAHHPAVASSRPAEKGEGGDAFTLLWVGPG